eukprot:11483474-Alexandrium_andersonii.AAC.1
MTNGYEFPPLSIDELAREPERDDTPACAGGVVRGELGAPPPPPAEEATAKMPSAWRASRST